MKKSKEERELERNLELLIKAAAKAALIFAAFPGLVMDWAVRGAGRLLGCRRRSSSLQQTAIFHRN